MAAIDYAAIFRDTQQRTLGIKFAKPELIKGLFDPYEPSKRNEKIVEVIIENVDTFEAAKSLNAKGGKCLVLNMASDFMPGGGIINKPDKRGAQEEHLCRVSNLLNTLLMEFYKGRGKKSLGVDEAILSTEVTVIRDANFNVIEPFTVGVVSCAGLRKPEVNKEKYRYPRDRKCMKDKINLILQIADYYGYDSLVLGAWGCGCFANPPVEVAKLFNECILEFKYSFRYITFAILERDGYLGRIFRENISIV